MADKDSERRSRVSVPEPGGSGSDARADASDLSDRAIPLDASGAIVRWSRRHVIEISIFVSVIVLLSVGSFALMRDPGPGSVRDVDAVGPSPGQALGPYIAVRRRALDDAAALGGNRSAVVSFRKRLSAPDLDAIAIPAGVAIDGIIVGIDSDELEILPGETEPAISNWITSQRSRFESQLQGAEERLAASPSPTPVADWFETEKARATRAIERLDSGAVIEGLIVRGPVRDLALIQQNSDVVLVDLAPDGKSASEIIPVLVGVGSEGSE